LQTYTVINEKQADTSGKITILKKDAKDNDLGGAEFTLYDVDNKPIKSVVTKINPSELFLDAEANLDVTDTDGNKTYNSAIENIKELYNKRNGDVDIGVVAYAFNVCDVDFAVDERIYNLIEKE
jgi:hypothetical protein